MARCAQEHKGGAVARLLLPEITPVKTVSKELTRVSVATLERWRRAVLSEPETEKIRNAACRCEAVSATAAMDEAGRSARCREQGASSREIERWIENAMVARAPPGHARPIPQQTRVDHDVGASVICICEVAGIDVDTRQRGKHGGGLQRIDRRSRGVHSRIAFALTLKRPRHKAAAGGCARVILP